MLNQFVERRALGRLEALEEDYHPSSKAEVDWSRTQSTVGLLGDRLGRAGIISAQSRKIASYLPPLFVGVGLAFAIFFGSGIESRPKFILILVISAYCGYAAYLMFLRWREREVKRQILFGLPIFLESMILIVESGIGLLPALSRVVKTRTGRSGYVHEIFGIVYQLSSSGVPFGRALEMVSEKLSNRTLQHVLLHLELSGVEGGELVPSLRSLSEHVHKEWQLSVEERVKRLENLVVFPVFLCVIGLVLLTAAVPLVSVIGLREKLQAAKGGVGAISSFESPKSLEE